MTRRFIAALLLLALAGACSSLEEQRSYGEFRRCITNQGFAPDRMVEPAWARIASFKSDAENYVFIAFVPSGQNAEVAEREFARYAATIDLPNDQIQRDRQRVVAWIQSPSEREADALERCL